MADDREKTSSKDAMDPAAEQATVAVAGVLFVGPVASGKGGRSRIWLGPAAGWRVPRGIHQWERELSFVLRASMTPALASALRATRPEEQIAPKRFPMAAKAVEVSPILALSSNLAQAAQEQGVRVHTIGVDRVSGDFYYFEEGGGREPVRVQGSLVDMLAPSLKASTTNDEIAVLMDGILDRLLLALSEGKVSELDVELADALPRLSRDGTGLAGTDLDAFEAEATSLATRATRWEAAARQLPEALATAARGGKASAPVPLFGEAARETKPALDLVLSGKPLQLSSQPVWTVKGAPRLEEKPAAKPQPSPAAPRVAAKVEAPRAESPRAPRVETPRAESPRAPRAEPKAATPVAAKKPEARPTPSPSPARVETKLDPALPPGPVRPRVQSSVDTMPPPNPVLSHVSDRPPRPSPSPTPPRAGTKPTPLKTPVPPRPPAEAPLMSAPAPSSKPDLAPSPVPATAPAPAPASASASRPELAPPPAVAPASASASAPASVPPPNSRTVVTMPPTKSKKAKSKQKKSKSKPPKSAAKVVTPPVSRAPAPPPPSDLPIVPSVASSATRVASKKPSTTMIVVVFAVLALAYVAFRSFH
jgi:hypothetical protein